MPREILQEELRLTLKDQEHQTRAKVLEISQESELCYVKMREKHPQYIPIHDLSITK
jgi:hypothetical protein